MLINFQLPVITSSIISFAISFIFSLIFIKINSNFRAKDNSQRRLNSLDIVPLGGIAMATSFFICVRLLGEAGSEFVYISMFALAIATVGVVDDFLNLNWKVKIIFQFLLSLCQYFI